MVLVRERLLHEIIEFLSFSLFHLDFVELLSIQAKPPVDITTVSYEIRIAIPNSDGTSLTTVTSQKLKWMMTKS